MITPKNLVCTISPSPYANPLLLVLHAPNPFYLGVPVTDVALVGSGGSGQGYDYTIVGSSSALPTGLTLEGSSGVITGTPTVQGIYEFIAEVEDSDSNVFLHSFTITIGSGLFATTYIPTPGELTIPYRFEFIVRDVTGFRITSGFTLASGSLPAGLSISTAGVISGTPTAPAGITYGTVNVTQGGASLDIPISITIYEAVLLAFVEDRDPPNGWGGGAGTWLPSIIRGEEYTVNLVVTGGVPPYSFTESLVDPWPTDIHLRQQNRIVRGKTMDVASSNPVLSAIQITDAVGGTYLAQRAIFIIDAQQGRIQPQRNGADVSGGNGPLKFNLQEGDGVSIDADNDGDTVNFRISAHGGIQTINGVGPDSSGNIQIIGIEVNSSGQLYVVCNDCCECAYLTNAWYNASDFAVVITTDETFPSFAVSGHICPGTTYDIATDWAADSSSGAEPTIVQFADNAWTVEPPVFGDPYDTGVLTITLTAHCAGNMTDAETFAINPIYLTIIPGTYYTPPGPCDDPPTDWVSLVDLLSLGCFGVQFNNDPFALYYGYGGTTGAQTFLTQGAASKFYQATGINPETWISFPGIGDYFGASIDIRITVIANTLNGASYPGFIDNENSNSNDISAGQTWTYTVADPDNYFTGAGVGDGAGGTGAAEWLVEIRLTP